MVIVKWLSDNSIEIDDVREEYHKAQWRCKYKSLAVSGSGEEVRLVPLPSRQKLRQGSRTRVQTPTVAHQGTVRRLSKGGIAKIQMADGMTGEETIQAVDIEKYNELNLKFIQTTEYAVRYLSKERCSLNAFQQLQLLNSYDALPKEPLQDMKSNSFYEQSGLELDNSQELAVSNCDHAVSFVEGPPGTGKTTVLTAMVARGLASGKGVLVIGETNSSVKQVYYSLQKNNICYDDRMTLIVTKEHFNEHKSDYDVYYKHNPSRSHKQVLLCTLSKAKQLPLHMLMQYQDTSGEFLSRDMAILDEGARVSSFCFSEVLPLFDEVKRLVVCGDRRQGGPFSKKGRKLQSVITMLEERSLSNKKGIIKRSFLNVQYRMQYDIGELISNTFYEGRILSMKKAGGHNLYCHYVTGWAYEDDLSTCCENEAELALRYGIILQDKHRDSKVVILCYYYGQIILLRHMMQSSGHNLRVYSVDSYQGMEADYVILSTCAQRKNMSPHIADKERACVAMSRGKNRLIILGNPRTLHGNDLWSGMLQVMRKISGNALGNAAIQ